MEAEAIFRQCKSGWNIDLRAGHVVSGPLSFSDTNQCVTCVSNSVSGKEVFQDQSKDSERPSNHDLRGAISRDSAA